jgi:Icc protein
MSINRSLKVFFSIILALICVTTITEAADKHYNHIVVLGDPHLPGETLTQKEQVRKTINGWADVDLVVAVGDITKEVGNDDEYAKAKAYFSVLTKPLALIGGNHDYIYEDWLSKSGTKVKAGEYIRTNKLNHFKKTFGLSEVYYKKQMGLFLLIFLTPDDLQTSLLATISKTQYTWFSDTVSTNREKPTIVFFHAPLHGTLDDYNKNANKDNFVAQPQQEIRKILADNPQVFLWVSGHTHTPPSEPSFSSTVNRYDGRVMNIHTTDMARKRIYTNSLFLYEDRVTVKTFDHEKGSWMENLERNIPTSLSQHKDNS